MTDAKKDLLYWSQRTYQKGLSPATSGNISVRVGENILITPTGACLNDMAEEDLVLMDMDTNIIEGAKKPSMEKYLHICIYNQREDIKAIIHSHCPYITAFAVARKKISKPIMPEFVYNFGEIPLAPYGTPSTLKLAQETAKYFKKSNSVLMTNHGIVVGAESLQKCFYNLETIRAYCQTYFASEILGGAKPLTQKQINDMRQLKG